MGKKKVVICGSMYFVEQMSEWQKKLESLGFEVYTPVLFDFHKIRDEEGDLERFEEYKRRETKNHFEKVNIADILLILNYDKNGKRNYIGGNTFAEIAYAVALNLCHGKSIEIYTVNPLPEYVPYYEELHAWQVKQFNLEQLTNNE